MGLFRPYERNDKAASSTSAASADASVKGADHSKTTVKAPSTGAAKSSTRASATVKQSETPVTTLSPGEERPAGPAKKTTATPSRKQAEEARRERLHPTLSKKESKARARDARMAKRDEAIKTADAQPGKVLARDYVDSKRHFAQFTMPLIVACLVLSLIGGMVSADIMTWTSVLTWLVILGLIVDVIIVWRGYRRLHAQRLPNEPTKGLMGYVINRTINPRRLRMPAPRVKIGDPV